jgi:hypothetical protein
MKVFNLELLCISKWFQANQFTLSVKKNKVRFTPTKFSQCTDQSSY